MPVTRDNKTVACGTNLAGSDVLPLGGAIAGQVYIPTAAVGLTSLTFHAAPAADGTYLPMYDSTGTAITLTVVAGRNYTLPAALFGALFVKAVGNVAGSVTFIQTVAT